MRGAELQRAAGIITKNEKKEILAIVSKAVVRDFRPLLYVIPYGPVASMLKKVAVAHRAHPLSVEYIIERLPRTMFDVIQLERGS